MPDTDFRPQSGRKPRRSQIAARRAFEALNRIFHIEAVSGLVLLLAAAAALIWANSPWSESYRHLWHMPVRLGLGDFVFDQPLHFWINDALMAVFFLMVGMEVRQEIHAGSLSDPRQASLPIAAAVGGVTIPAIIYLGLNSGGPPVNGWAVPVATDIAFAVGVLALLGKSIPGSLRIFLLALAIIDDIIAVLIIAFFYSGGLDPIGFAVAVLGVFMVLGMQRAGVGSALPYVVPGAVVWIGILMTGAHPTLAGVVLGLMTPVKAAPPARPPVIRVQAALHPWVAYGVMPLFALANAGVSLGGVDLTQDTVVRVVTGVTVGLVLGKPLGILLASWIMVRLGLSSLPRGVGWSGIMLVGLLAGIGFTMSIFIAMLAFSAEELVAGAKLGVLLASVLAAVLGLAWGMPPGRLKREKA